MDLQTLIATLTDGLSADQAATVRSAIERDAVKSKVGGWKQESEYSDIQTRTTALQAELDGDAASGKLGARAYREWYEKNFSAVQKLGKDVEAYKAKYGDLDGQGAPTTPTQPTARQYTDADIQTLVDKRITEGYSPRWTELLVANGQIIQKHFLAGRKTPIDFDALGKLAATKFNGNLEQAYDEYDRPERERVGKEEEEARINKRVDEELAKRGASAHFPSGADMSPSALSSRTREVTDKFDPQSLRESLAKEWSTAGV